MPKQIKPNKNQRAKAFGAVDGQKRSGTLPLWIEQARHTHSEDARNAWSRLLAIVRVEKRKLTPVERTALAQRLHNFYLSNKSRLDARGVTTGGLCKIAFGADDSKEWYRLTLPEGEDAVSRGIRANGWKYIQIIEALSDALGDSKQTIASELTRDTVLDPYRRPADELSEVERVQAALSAIVRTIDSEFGLFETYQLTAELKRASIEMGGRLCWPLYDLDPDDACEPAFAGETLRAMLETASDPSQAYYRLADTHGRKRISRGEWWIHGFDCGHLQEDAFFYVPHVPLGYALIWDLPYRRHDPFAYQDAVHRQLAAIRSSPQDLEPPLDDWDEVAKVPVGQTMPRGEICAARQYHFWLLAYPHPDGRGVVPTLYQAGEEGGAYMTPLDTKAVAMLRDAIWVSADAHESMFDRLLSLLTDGCETPEGCEIERALRRTAPWLAHNPVLKLEQEKEQRNFALDRYLHRN